MGWPENYPKPHVYTTYHRTGVFTYAREFTRGKIPERIHGGVIREVRVDSEASQRFWPIKMVMTEDT